MDTKIIWTENSLEDLRIIISYLKKEWPEKTLTNFSKQLFGIIGLIRKYPGLGKVYDITLNIRKIMITKHYYLFYSSDNEKLYLLNIFDTRQNPDKLNF